MGADFFSGSTADSVYDAEDRHFSTFSAIAAGTGGPGRSPDGGNAIAADAKHEVGTMYQTITGLTAGDTYAVSFYQASMQQIGYSGSYTGDWQVSFGQDALVSQTLSNPAGRTSPWTLQTLMFSATAASETLGFLAQASTGAQPPFLLLDGVSVTDVPEPSSLSMLALAGLAGAAFGAARRHRIPARVRARRSSGR